MFSRSLVITYFIPVLNVCEISKFSYMGEKPVENEVYAANQNALYLKLWIINDFSLKNNVQKYIFNGKINLILNGCTLPNEFCHGCRLT